jgi:large conductance mechanosensitive channel
VITMVKGFRDFLLKGDLITAAVGLVMALATFALTETLVSSLITPLIGAVIGEPDFGSLSFTINHSVFRYGAFIDALIVFVGTAAAVYFFVIVPYKRYQEIRGVSAKTRPCPECTTSISIAARRCPACTAVVIPESV